MKTLRMIAVAACMALPVAAHAQDGQTEKKRPLQELFFNETVYPQEKGEVQITVGSLVDRTEHDKVGLFPVSLEFGLTNSWQIDASLAGYALFHESPFDDLRRSRATVGTKYSFMNIGHSPLHAAVGVEAEFPGDLEADLGDTELEVEPYFSLAADAGRFTLFGTLSSSFNPHHNAADVLADVIDDPSPVSFGGLVRFHYVTAALEYAKRSTSLPWREEGSPILTPSVMIHPGHDWELGFGFPIGLGDASHTPNFAMNIIKEFGGK